MRLTGDYRFTHIKENNHLVTKKRRIEKIHEEEFEDELEEAMKKKQPESKKKNFHHTIQQIAPLTVNSFLSFIKTIASLIEPIS